VFQKKRRSGFESVWGTYKSGAGLSFPLIVSRKRIACGKSEPLNRVPKESVFLRAERVTLEEVVLHHLPPGRVISESGTRGRQVGQLSTNKTLDRRGKNLIGSLICWKKWDHVREIRSALRQGGIGYQFCQQTAPRPRRGVTLKKEQTFPYPIRGSGKKNRVREEGRKLWGGGDPLAMH